MKKLLLLFVFVSVLVSCGNCNAQKDNPAGQTASVPDTTAVGSLPDGHNAQNSLSYAGMYEGTIPCADCPGIDIVITLDYQGNYTKKMTYREKGPDNVFATSGKFTWHNDGFVIRLAGDNDGETYKVIEGALVMLDTEGNEITGGNADKYLLKQKTVTE